MPTSSRTEGPEEHNYLVSVSDLMAGLLFLFIILIAALALDLGNATVRHQNETQRLQGAYEARSVLLRQVRQRLNDKGVQVRIDEEQGVLHLGKEGITFPVGMAEPEPAERLKVFILRDILATVLPCFAHPQGDIPECGELNRNRMTLEAVLVEGHADKQAVTPGGKYQDNWDLSVARAITIFRDLDGSTLGRLCNSHKQKILSVSGYGDSRPVSQGTNPAELSQDRRIDLRFIMEPPSPSEDPIPGPLMETKKRLSGEPAH